MRLRITTPFTEILAVDEVPTTNAEEERKRLRYRGSHIPWFVHCIWIIFWVIAIGYVLTYLFPAIRTEFLSPP
jgi:hypothetical protein